MDAWATNLRRRRTRTRSRKRRRRTRSRPTPRRRRTSEARTPPARRRADAIRRVLGSTLLALAACASRAPTAPLPSEPLAPPKTLAEAEAELAERIRTVVVAERPRLRACYEEGL